MGMSTHVRGFRPPDDKWSKMKDVWDSCVKANVPIPIEVEDFFDGTSPDTSGIEINLEEYCCCEHWEDNMCEGFQIDLDKLPSVVKFIRFYNSY